MFYANAASTNAVADVSGKHQSLTFGFPNIHSYVVRLHSRTDILKAASLRSE